MTEEEKILEIARELDPGAILQERKDDVDLYAHILFSNGAFGVAPRWMADNREEVIKFLQIAFPPWTFEWPTEPGSYWFYGWCSRHHDDPPKMYYVEIWQLENGVIRVVNGAFLYTTQGAYGKWLKAKLPQKPVLEKP